MRGKPKQGPGKNMFFFLAFVLFLIVLRLGIESFRAEDPHEEPPPQGWPGYVVYVDTTDGLCGSCFAIQHELNILKHEMASNYTFVVEDEGRDVDYYQAMVVREGLPIEPHALHVDTDGAFRDYFQLSEGSKVLFFDESRRLVANLPLRQVLDQPKLLLTLADH